MSELRDIVGRFLDATQAVTKGNYDTTRVKQLRSLIKSSPCSNIDFKGITLDSVRKLAGLDMYTGEQLVDATENILREGLADNNKLAAGTNSFKSKVNMLIRNTNKATNTDGYVNYSNRFDKALKEMNGIVVRALDLVNDDNKHLSPDIDTASLIGLVKDISGLMEDYQAALEDVKTSSLNRNTKVSEQEAMLADVLEVRLRQKMSQAESTLRTYERLADIGPEFQENTDLFMREGYHHADVVKQEMAEMVDAWQSADYAGFAKKLGKFFKNRKALSAGSKAKGMFARGLGDLGGGMSKLALVGGIGGVFMQFVQLFFKANDMAVSFNQELIKSHGLVSLGLDLNPNVKVDSYSMFKKQRELFTSFGADTNTYITPDGLMELTSAYENAGIKMTELTRDTEEFNALMVTTVAYFNKAGISMEELANIQANWKRNLSMDVKLTNAMLEQFQYSAQNVGVPMGMLIQNLMDSGYDFSLWNDSMSSVLSLQNQILKRKDIPMGAGKEAVKYFGEYISKIESVKWAEIADKAPASTLMDLLTEDEKRLKDRITKASSDEERKKATMLLNKIQRGKASGDPLWVANTFADAASMESKYTLLRTTLFSHFGDDLHGQLVAGNPTIEFERRLKAFLGFSGSSQEWEKVKIGLIGVTDPDFDPKEFHKQTLDMADAINISELQKLGGEADAANKQQLTLEQMYTSMILKWTHRLVTVATNLVNHFKRMWVLKLFGGSDNEAESTQAREAAKGEILALCSKFGTEQDPAKRLSLLADICAQATIFTSHGGDVSEIEAYLKGAGLENGDIIAALQKGAAAAPKGGSGGGVGGGGTGEYSEQGLAAALDQAGILDPTERAQFMAQMAHESGNFQYNTELRSDASAEAAYGVGTARGKNLGNTQRGDGAKYKGRGFVQLTGRWNYMHYGQLVGVDLINNPDLAADPKIASKIAIAYWNDRVKRNTKDFTNTSTVTRLINGGQNHLAERQKYFISYQARAAAGGRSPAPSTSYGNQSGGPSRMGGGGGGGSRRTSSYTSRYSYSVQGLDQANSYIGAGARKR